MCVFFYSEVIADSIEHINTQFLKQLDDELAKVERHFTFEMSFLVDRIAGAEEELHALNEEEKEDLAAMDTTTRLQRVDEIEDVLPEIVRKSDESENSASQSMIGVSSAEDVFGYQNQISDKESDGEMKTIFQEILPTIRKKRLERQRTIKDKEKEKEFENRVKRVSFR